MCTSAPRENRCTTEPRVRCCGGRVLTTGGRSECPPTGQESSDHCKPDIHGEITVQLHHGNQVSLVILVTLIECRGWLTFYTRLAQIIIIGNCDWLQNIKSQYFRCTESVWRLRNQCSNCECTLWRPQLGVSQCKPLGEKIELFWLVLPHTSHRMSWPRPGLTMMRRDQWPSGAVIWAHYRRVITNCLSFVRTIPWSLIGLIRRTAAMWSAVSPGPVIRVATSGAICSHESTEQTTDLRHEQQRAGQREKRRFPLA